MRFLFIRDSSPLLMFASIALVAAFLLVADKAASGRAIGWPPLLICGSDPGGVVRAVNLLPRAEPVVQPLPFKLHPSDLQRGRERFEMFCGPCHGKDGNAPRLRSSHAAPSLHSERLRELPPGYLVSVITQGSGKMTAFGTQIAVKDRWRIAAHIKSLQAAQ